MIQEQELNKVVEYIKANSASEQTVAELRKTFEGRHFTYCCEDDITFGKPVFEDDDGFSIYLVDAREACLKLTSDLEIATGYVVAEVIGD